jgi:hypothetical protein
VRYVVSTDALQERTCKRTAAVIIFFVAGDRTDRETDRQTTRQNIHDKKRLSRAIPARFAV